VPTDPPIREVRAGRARIQRVWESTVPGAALASLALAPAAWLYRAVTWGRNALYDRGIMASRRAAIPVVSVGNIAVGGTGKTPFSAWLAVEIAGRGHRPAVLHGGYAPDEPALHRAWNPDIPVIVGRNRLAGAGRAAERGATVAILDDGFQHRRLARDLDIVLVAAETWEGPRHLLPRGPWREPVSAMRRADLIVVTRKSADASTAARVAVEVEARAGGRPCCVAHVRPAAWRAPPGATAARPEGSCVAVAGVAAPDSFIANARAAGADVVAALLFGDHHDYTRDDAARIIREAAGGGIVTTEKDATKLRPLLPDAAVWALRQEVGIEAGADVLAERLDRIGT
jgi:tetraacyldisaccharide 4'-kinase